MKCRLDPRALALAGLLASRQLLPSAAPAPDSLFPAGGRLGTSFEVAVGGRLDGWPVGAWTDHAGLKFSAGTNRGSFSVTIGKDVPPGPHLVRFHNSEGAAEPRTFVVGTREELLEADPNDDFRKPQRIARLPVVINGKLERGGDVDSFAFSAQAGTWIVAAVDAYALGSAIDPSVQLLDEQGVRLALNHDTHNLDPLLAWRVEKSGTYIVQIMGFAHPPAAEVRLLGSATAVYRLTLTTGPFARQAFPAGVKRGEKAPVSLVGWNLPAGLAHPLDASGAQPSDKLLSIPAGPAGDLVLVDLGDAPEVAEAEPNDGPAVAQKITLPATVNGRIGQPGDVDRFQFTAKKGDRHTFRVRSAALHSAMDPWLRVEDAQGVAFTENDDGDGLDARISWTAPAEGVFLLAIGDRFAKGGPEFVYRIETVPVPPHFSATIPTHAFYLETGKTNEIKVTTARVEGFTGKIHATVQGLPPGVTASEAEVPPGGGEVKLVLTASAEAKAAGVPLQILLTAPDAKPPQSSVATFGLRGVEPRGDRLINEGRVAWLTVANQPAPPAPPAKKKR